MTLLACRSAGSVLRQHRVTASGVTWQLLTIGPVGPAAIAAGASFIHSEGPASELPLSWGGFVARLACFWRATTWACHLESATTPPASAVDPACPGAEKPCGSGQPVCWQVTLPHEPHLDSPCPARVWCSLLGWLILLPASLPRRLRPGRCGWDENGAKYPALETASISAPRIRS